MRAVAHCVACIDSLGGTDQAEIEAQKKVVLKMADDVEAELEAPEALQIAKEDILLSKMEQERERCGST